MLMFPYLHQIPPSFQISYNLFSRLKAIQTCIFSSVFIYFSIRSENIDNLQSCPFSHLKIIWIMSRSHLHHPSSKLSIYIFIGNDRDFSIHQWQKHLLPDQMLIPFILRMHRNSRISEHRFRSRGRKDQLFISSHDRIGNLPEMPFRIHMFYLIISKCSSAPRTSVYHIFPLINQIIMVKFHKNLSHRLRKSFIHRESFLFPIKWVSKFSLLLSDDPTVLFFPFPSFFDKFFSSKVFFGLSFFCQGSFHLILSSDSCVVGSWHS